MLGRSQAIRIDDEKYRTSPPIKAPSEEAGAQRYATLPRRNETGRVPTFAI